jgi:hypothetical protein
MEVATNQDGTAGTEELGVTAAALKSTSWT